MKTTLFTLLLFLSCNLMGQIDSELSKICSERGHIKSSVFMTTDLYCPPYVEDYEDSTVMVYPGCNTMTYVCLRCGEKILESGQVRRIVLWRRSQQLFDINCQDSIIFLNDSLLRKLRRCEEYNLLLNAE